MMVLPVVEVFVIQSKKSLVKYSSKNDTNNVDLRYLCRTSDIIPSKLNRPLILSRNISFSLLNWFKTVRNMFRVGHWNTPISIGFNRFQSRNSLCRNSRFRFHSWGISNDRAVYPSFHVHIVYILAQQSLLIMCTIVYLFIFIVQLFHRFISFPFFPWQRCLRPPIHHIKKSYIHEMKRIFET